MIDRIMVAGATGLVGRTMLRILEERNFPAKELIAVASERSAGTSIPFRGKQVTVTTAEKALERRPGIALFSAGKEVSRIWAPVFAQSGCRVIDNSSCWRMDAGVKLIVPEINGHLLGRNDLLIANPNCSTIQMVMALASLHRKFRLKRIVASTYQSVTGSGQKGLEQLGAERLARVGEKQAPAAGSIYPCPIDLNVIPLIGDLTPDGYTAEEIKMKEETRKILDDPGIRVSATTVRVPVEGGHCVAVNAQFVQPFSMDEVFALLGSFPGLVLNDGPGRTGFAVPREAGGTDPVYVGRVRRDTSAENTLDLWTVADNLRKGAALNAVQIAERLLDL